MESTKGQFTPKDFDAAFFEEESPAMWYVVGASYGRYFLESCSNKNTWSSRYRDLVEIVRRELGSEHAVVHDKATDTFKLRIKSPMIRDRLHDLGCVPHREERQFPPSIEEGYINHFLRGFFDAHVTAYSTKEGTCHIQIYHKNPPFLQSMHEALVEAKAVRDRKMTRTDRLNYQASGDTHGIFDFLYQDPTFVEENGLYVQAKKERFEQSLSQ